MSKVKSFLKEYSLIIFLSIISPFILAPIVDAATEQEVTATVTVSNVSLSVSSGTISYGTLSVSSTEDTTTNGINNTQVVTNEGNVAIDVTVKGVDVSPWTLGGTAGADIYTHKTCTATCDTTPTWAAMTTSYGADVLNNVASLATGDIDFQVGTPTSTASYTAKNVNVTLLATEH